MSERLISSLLSGKPTAFGEFSPKQRYPTQEDGVAMLSAITRSGGIICKDWRL